MATHVITEIYPDCPNCGAELRERMAYKQQTETNPFGGRVGWWHCVECGYDSALVKGGVYPEIKREVR